MTFVFYLLLAIAIVPFFLLILLDMQEYREQGFTADIVLDIVTVTVMTTFMGVLVAVIDP